MQDGTLMTKQGIFYKTCTKCKKVKENTLFYKRTLSSDSLHSWCKECKDNHMDNKHSASPVAFVRRLHQMMVYQRKIRKIKVEVTVNEFIQIWTEQYEKFGMKCPYSGIEMTYKKGSGKLFYNISVDRFDNTKPYQDGNIVFCCMVVNRMKQELSINEFWKICKSVAENNAIKELYIY